MLLITDFKFDNEPEQQNTSGTIQRVYDEVGTGSYSVRVYAYSSSNESINILQSFTVLYVEDDSIESPSNLTLTTSIVGENSSNPYGDGSGEVNFKCTSYRCCILRLYN